MKIIYALSIVGIVCVAGMAETVSKMSIVAQMCLVTAGAIAAFIIMIIPAIKKV